MTEVDRLAMLKEFLSTNPNDCFARYGLAMEYVRQGTLEPALGHGMAIAKTRQRPIESRPARPCQSAAPGEQVRTVSQRGVGHEQAHPGA